MITIIELAGVRAVPQSDSLAGYGNCVGPGWRLVSRVRWAVSWAPLSEMRVGGWAAQPCQHATSLHLEVTHSVVEGLSSVRIVQYWVAGVYSGPSERALPGSGDNREPEQAVREFVEQFALVVALERTLLAQKEHGAPCA